MFKPGTSRQIISDSDTLETILLQTERDNLPGVVMFFPPIQFFATHITTSQIWFRFTTDEIKTSLCHLQIKKMYVKVLGLAPIALSVTEPLTF